MAALEEIAQLLRRSLLPNERKDAEQTLRAAEAKPEFSLLLLHVVASESFDPTLRLAGALYFKNFIKRNWTTADGGYKLPQNEVDAIKREIIGLMMSVPPNIQSQLGEAVSVIAESDFYERWSTLTKVPS